MLGRDWMVRCLISDHTCNFQHNRCCVLRHERQKHHDKNITINIRSFQRSEKEDKMEGSYQSTNDHLFEDDLIRMCIEQLLDDEDERETLSNDDIFTPQKSKNLHFTTPNYQVIGQQPLKHGVIGSKTTYSTGKSGKFQRNSATSKLNPNAKVFVPQSYAVRTSS